MGDDARQWSLSDVSQAHSDVLTRLMSVGLDESAALDIRGMFQKAAQRLAKNKKGLKDDAKVEAFWVPGRIEVAGKHTDYAGGRSLLAAVTKGFAVVSTSRNDSKVGVCTQFADGREDYQELEITADMAQLKRFQGLSAEEGGWALYPAATIQRLASNFGIKHGADISMECNLPEASGMSSSSAVICYMWLVLDKYNQISRTNSTFKRCIQSPAELYTYLGNIENGKHFNPGRSTQLDGAGGVGTFGGSEDHTAIMSCTRDSLSLWQYCPTEHLLTVTVPKDVSFVVAVSGAKAEKTGDAMSDYNDAALLASWAAAAYTVSRLTNLGISTEKPLTASDMATIFDHVNLYNPKTPNLAEVVRQERSKLIEKGLGGSDLNDRVKGQIDLCLQSVADTFKELLKKNSQSLGLNIEGLNSAQITIDTLKVRFEQFFNESETINPQMATAFASRDYNTLGLLTDQSHEATVTQLKNTIPETAWLARWARRTTLNEESEWPKETKKLKTQHGIAKPAPGTVALAASAFGAGFGGSCWALVYTSQAQTFCEAWKAAYNARFPEKPGGLMREFFVMSPGPGAFNL